MVRLFFNRGPFDGGQLDVDSPHPASRKATERGEVKIPGVAYVACGSTATRVYVYHITRVITPFSAEYTHSGVFLEVCNVPRCSPIVIIGA